MQDWLSVGESFPPFSLKSAQGMVTNKDLEGKLTVLFYYPKDNTPGCTKEVCSFRDQMSEFKALDCQVFGVSLDDLESHQRFSQEYGLNFPLLVDVDHKLAEQIGSWRLKKLYGRESWGIQRSTWVLGPEVEVLKLWKAVRVNGHSDKVLEFIKDYRAK